MLLAGVGCKTTQQSYFEQDIGGNAWVITLPKGTHIEVPDGSILNPAFDEIKDGVLVKDCKLVSRAYLDKRDETEIELNYMIKDLKIRKDAP